MSIFDLSKVHIYSFYYDVLKARYKDDVRLIYADTDSYDTHTHKLSPKTSMKTGRG